MFRRSGRCTAIGTFALLLTLLVSIAPRAVFASHFNITADGDSTDLVAAINANLGPDKGGFTIADPAHDAYTLTCGYVNGYDMVHAYALFDFKDAMGHLTPNDMTFYAGWTVDGIVGDVDGDGNPDTFSLVSPGGSSGCAISDEPGIGPNESYNVLLDLDCTGGADDIRIQIKNNVVMKVVAGVPTAIPGATFGRNGHFLELKIPNYQNLLQGLPTTADLCDARVRLTSNAEFDGPGEDFQPSFFQLALLPSVDVTKTPPLQSICAGSPVSWTITVTNDGLCLLNDVTVNDVLGTGLTFDSATPSPSSQMGPNASWTFVGADLGPGDQIQITLHAKTGMPCAADTMENDVSVEAVHLSNCNPAGLPPPTATDNATAKVACRDLPPCDIAGDTETCVGASKTFTTTVTSPFTRQWVVSSVPPGICSSVGPYDGSSITVDFTGVGTCKVQLIVRDPLNSEVCADTCDHEIDVHAKPPCGIDACPPAESPLTTSCVGDTLCFTTEGYPAYSVAWSLIGPPGACQFIGPTNGGSVQVKLIAAGSCTLKLVVYDPSDSADCNTMCTLPLTAHPAPPCNISGATTAEVGDTVDVSTTVDPNTYQLMWMDSSNPPGICHIVPPGTGQNIRVVITGTGTCTITLRVKDPANPSECFHDCPLVIEVAPMGFACPHTIGFWRQQCAQKGNGSTKVCLDGMRSLWRCVITNTDVIKFIKNDGSYETTASLRALSDANLFDALCSQLQGPRPMTLLNMTEIQYLGLMLNVCSGALPLNTPISNGYMGTVQGAIDAIENAINTGQDLGHWEQVADDINNRLGVLAADCPDGDDFFRHIPPCGMPAAPGQTLGLGFGDPQVLASKPMPNPVTQSSTSIFFNVPSRLGSSDVSITLFDVAGRVVRTLNPGNLSAGEHSADWDLHDDSGSQVPSGIYFYRLTVGDESITEKLMVVRR